MILDNNGEGERTSRPVKTVSQEASAELFVMTNHFKASPVIKKIHRERDLNQLTTSN